MFLSFNKVLNLIPIGQRTTPSTVAFTDDGQRLVGISAVRCYSTVSPGEKEEARLGEEDRDWTHVIKKLTQ